MRDRPPEGPGWIHEIKLDGFRVQVHTGSEPIIFSRNGLDLSNRFGSVVRSLSKLKPAIIDAEIVALDTCGRPDFRALMGGSRQLCIYGFDLLHLDGDLQSLPLNTCSMAQSFHQLNAWAAELADAAAICCNASSK